MEAYLQIEGDRCVSFNCFIFMQQNSAAPKRYACIFPPCMTPFSVHELLLDVWLRQRILRRFIRFREMSICMFST